MFPFQNDEKGATLCIKVPWLLRRLEKVVFVCIRKVELVKQKIIEVINLGIQLEQDKQGTYFIWKNIPLHFLKRLVSMTLMTFRSQSINLSNYSKGSP